MNNVNGIVRKLITPAFGITDKGAKFLIEDMEAEKSDEGRLVKVTLYDTKIKYVYCTTRYFLEQTLAEIIPLDNAPVINYDIKLPAIAKESLIIDKTKAGCWVLRESDNPHHRDDDFIAMFREGETKPAYNGLRQSVYEKMALVKSM